MGSADSGKRPAAAGSEWRLDKRGRYGASLEQSAFQRLVRLARTG